MQMNMRALILTSGLLAGIACGPAYAASTALPAPETPVATSTTPATKLDSTAAADDLTTGTLGTPKTRDQKLQDCMAIWEPATHMTKAQWKRTCVRQLDEEPRP
jgi:hypothetical protein